tara:strand:+ start:1846 stop:4755 length:2910 start_codon:yes stop_codon:yes gene_type:complete
MAEKNSVPINNMADKPKKKIKFNVKKEFKFRGRKQVYYGPTSKKLLAEKLKISTSDIDKLVKGDTKRVAYDSASKQVKKIDISKPLLLKDFQSKKLTNKELVSQGKSELKIFKKLPNDLDRKVVIIFDYQIQISEDIKKGTITFTAFINKNTNIENLCIQEVLKKFSDVANTLKSSVKVSNIKVYENNESGNILPLTNMKLRLRKPPILNFVDNIDYTERKECVKDLMTEYYGKRYAPKNFYNMNNAEDMKNWCESKNIKLLLYDISGKIITANYPKIKNRNKSLIGLVYHNHLYPLKSNKLSKVKPLLYEDNEIILESKNFMNLLLDIIEEGIIPANVVMKNDSIVSFDYNNNIYICNEDYLECKKILKIFGLYDKINSTISFTKIGILIEELYLKENVDSFLPDTKRFLKGGYNYFTDNQELLKNDNITTIDANKFYPSCLRDLDYIYSVNMLENEIENNEKLESDYLYLVTPHQHSLLLPNTNIYLYDHLDYCKKQGLKFYIKEKIKIKKHKNYYKSLVNDLFKKVDNTSFKKIMNSLIGTFEMEGKTTHTKFNKFVNEDEKQRSEGYFNKIANDLYINFITEDNFNVSNKKLISIQIKDLSRRKLYEKMQQLNITENNLIKIKTDSITYIKANKECKLGNKLGMWKQEEVKLDNFNIDYTDYNHDSIIPKNNFDNTLINSYAGAGKTYDIINNIIPAIKGDYIILTPSHSSLKEYKRNNFNCEVIQKYEYKPELFKNKTIIVDEIGMVNYKGMRNIYLWSLLGNKIYCYGDFKQLLPVGRLTALNTNIFIKSTFSNIKTMDSNYRNDFSKEFYDKCIAGKLDKKELILKYLNNENSLNVCAYTNKTCEKYNNIISKKLGHDSIFSVGAKLICNTNELRKLGMYNKFIYEVKEVKDESIIFDDGTEILKKDCLKKEGKKDYLSFGYARTLHSYQGESIKDLYYPIEEIDFLTDRAFYTLISRIKTK